MAATVPGNEHTPDPSSPPLLEYVTLPACADCRRFQAVLARVEPDFPEVDIREVAADSPRGMSITVERGVLRFPVVVLDDEIIAIESVSEPQLRASLTAARNRR